MTWLRHISSLEDNVFDCTVVYDMLLATWEHWCQKAFSRVSDEPGIETEDKMHSMRMFQFLTASAKFGNKNQYLAHFSLPLKFTKFGI